MSPSSLTFTRRGRIFAPDPGRDPDVLWSCPRCAALVLGPDRDQHAAWHIERD